MSTIQWELHLLNNRLAIVKMLLERKIAELKKMGVK